MVFTPHRRSLSIWLSNSLIIRWKCSNTALFWTSNVNLFCKKHSGWTRSPTDGQKAFLRSSCPRSSLQGHFSNVARTITGLGNAHLLRFLHKPCSSRLSPYWKLDCPMLTATLSIWPRTLLLAFSQAFLAWPLKTDSTQELESSLRTSQMPSSR